MSAINGVTGSVSLVEGGSGEILLHVDRFSMLGPREMHVVTTFDSADGWDDQTAGLVKWTGTLEGFYQDAEGDALVASEIQTDTATLVLTASTGRTYTWSSNAVIRDLDFNVGVGVPGRWTAAFSGNGQPTIDA